MQVQGGCYCGAVRYQAGGEPQIKAQCHCRECQYLSGGSPNVTIGLPASEFKYTKGTPKQFTRSDLDTPVTREFCGECGTQLLSKSPVMPDTMLLKVGTLDEPAEFGGPEMAIFTVDKQAFHQVPEGVPAFERMPG